MADPLLWLVLFNAAVLVLLGIDLAVFHRRPHAVRVREALAWSAAWIGLALFFNLGLYYYFGPGPALAFLTGFLIEKSLSVDNLFVFLMIFAYFRVPAAHQHKVLFWGILGALVMRGVFIAVGVALIRQFHWVVYAFGAFLVLSGLRLGFGKERDVRPEKNPVLRLLRRFVPVTARYEGERFLVREGGRWHATPLLIVLVVVETTDILFAVDSIPAVLAVTTDPVIVYTSNVFAILGLRALYFALAGMMRLFHFLHYGLAAILVFVGVKMVLADWVEIPVGVALGGVAGVLTVSVAASLVWPARGKS